MNKSVYYIYSQEKLLNIFSDKQLSKSLFNSIVNNITSFNVDSYDDHFSISCNISVDNKTEKRSFNLFDPCYDDEQSVLRIRKAINNKQMTVKMSKKTIRIYYKDVQYLESKFSKIIKVEQYFSNRRAIYHCTFKSKVLIYDNLDLFESKYDNVPSIKKLRKAIDLYSDTVMINNHEVQIIYNKKPKKRVYHVFHDIPHDYTLKPKTFSIEQQQVHYESESKFWFRRNDSCAIQKRFSKYRKTVIYHRQKINRPVHLVYGEDQSPLLDANTFYFYQDKNTIRRGIDYRVANINKYGKEHNIKLIEYLYNISLTLFIINCSYGKMKIEDLNSDILLYYMVHLILWSGAMNNSEIDHTKGLSFEWIEYKFKKKVITFLTRPNEKYIELGRFCCCRTMCTCRYPSGWTLEKQKEWKKMNGIERKKETEPRMPRKKETKPRKPRKKETKPRKPYTKETKPRKKRVVTKVVQSKTRVLASKIIELYLQGMTRQNIQKQLNITQPGIRKVIREYQATQQ